MPNPKALGFIFATAVAVAAWSFVDQPPLQLPGTKRMAAMLAKIADQTDATPDLNPYWNERRAEVLRGRVASDKSARLPFATELLLQENLRKPLPNSKHSTPRPPRTRKRARP